LSASANVIFTGDNRIHLDAPQRLNRLGHKTIHLLAMAKRSEDVMNAVESPHPQLAGVSHCEAATMGGSNAAHAHATERLDRLRQQLLLNVQVAQKCSPHVSCPRVHQSVTRQRE
jgi:hypothetical protein